MRLSFFVPWITTGRGGTEHVGSVMANAMAQRGHAVTIHTFDNDAGETQWPLHEDIRLRCHQHLLDYPQRTQIMMELASERPDLIVGLGMNRNIVNYVGFAHRTGTPVLLSEHINPELPARLGIFSAQQRTITFSGAAGIHLLLPDYANGLPDYLQNRVHVLPNIVPAAETLADPSGAGTGRPTLLTVARLNPRKNVATLLHAFARSKAMRGWNLRIVGDGTERTRLETLARALRIRRSVNFVGTISEPYPEYARAQAFVLPSLDEGFPMVVLEAMAHGLPTIGFRACPGVNTQIRNGKTGILCEGPDPVESLSAALDRIAAEPDLRVEMGRNALQAFQADNDPALYADRVEAMFKAAIRTGNGPPDGCPETVARQLRQAIDFGFDAEFQGDLSSAS